MSKMNPEVKAKRVAALRSGEYEQTKGLLRKGDSFCCLGVLCNLHAQDHPEVARTQATKRSYMGASGVLPPEVAVWAGLCEGGRATVRIGHARTVLPAHNDDGRTFLQIAKAIEEQL